LNAKWLLADSRKATMPRIEEKNKKPQGNDYKVWDTAKNEDALKLRKSEET
jgi:hypothetical protein